MESDQYKPLSSSTDEEIIRVLANEGPMCRSKLAKLTGIARSTIYDAIVRLEIAGRMEHSIKKKGIGRPYTIFHVTLEGLT